MTWPPKCDRCGDPLHEPGALMFSPPFSDGRAEKFHLCVGCWVWVIDDVLADKDGQSRGQLAAIEIEEKRK